MIVIKAYNRERAVAYAARWALDRNPLFYNFTGIGGDCTNFVSQCVLAGSCVMNYTPDFGWYFISSDDRAPAWTGVEFFWSFMTGAPEFLEVNGGIGPFGREVRAAAVEPGDVVQLGTADGDYYHTLLVTGRNGSDILVSAHSNDVYNRPLSLYTAPIQRFLKIRGVAFELNGATDCFDALYNGLGLPVR